MKLLLACLFVSSLQILVSQAASTLLSSDFSGRTISGDGASNIGYTVTGIVDPGDLTVIENESNGVNDGTAALAGLFVTTAADGYLAPNLNIDNEDGWYVDIALSFAADTTSLSVTTLDLSINHFTNSGGAQTNNSARSDWRAEIIGSTSGTVISDSSLDIGSGYAGGPYAVNLDLTSSLDNSETWTLRIYSDYNGGQGNNAGLDAFTLHGTATVIPEPSVVVLGALSGLLLLRRKRS